MSISIISGPKAEIRVKFEDEGVAEIGVRVPDRLCGPTPANRHTIFSSPLCSNRLKWKTLLETKSNNAKFIADIFGDVSS